MRLFHYPSILTVFFQDLSSCFHVSQTYHQCVLLFLQMQFHTTSKSQLHFIFWRETNLICKCIHIFLLFGNSNSVLFSWPSFVEKHCLAHRFLLTFQVPPKQTSEWKEQVSRSKQGNVCFRKTTGFASLRGIDHFNRLEFPM